MMQIPVHIKITHFEHGGHVGGSGVYKVVKLPKDCVLEAEILLDYIPYYRGGNYHCSTIIFCTYTKLGSVTNNPREHAALIEDYLFKVRGKLINNDNTTFFYPLNRYVREHPNFKRACKFVANWLVNREKQLAAGQDSEDAQILWS